MTEKKVSPKKTKYQKRLKEEDSILADLKQKAKNPPLEIVDIQDRINKLVRKFVPKGVSLADELVRDRRKEEI